MPFSCACLLDALSMATFLSPVTKLILCLAMTSWLILCGLRWSKASRRGSLSSSTLATLTSSMRWETHEAGMSRMTTNSWACRASEKCWTTMCKSQFLPHRCCGLVYLGCWWFLMCWLILWDIWGIIIWLWTWFLRGCYVWMRENVSWGLMQSHHSLSLFLSVFPSLSFSLTTHCCTVCSMCLRGTRSPWTSWGSLNVSAARRRAWSDSVCTHHTWASTTSGTCLSTSSSGGWGVAPSVPLGHPGADLAVAGAEMLGSPWGGVYMAGQRHALMGKRSAVTQRYPLYWKEIWTAWQMLYKCNVLLM